MGLFTHHLNPTKHLKAAKPNTSHSQGTYIKACITF